MQIRSLGQSWELPLCFAGKTDRLLSLVVSRVGTQCVPYLLISLTSTPLSTESGLWHGREVLSTMRNGLDDFYTLF